MVKIFSPVHSPVERLKSPQSFISFGLTLNTEKETLIGGETNKLFYTDDPYDQDGWNTATVNGTDPAYSVIYVDNRYVCIGRSNNAWSDDLVTWTKVKHNNNNLKLILRLKAENIRTNLI